MGIAFAQKQPVVGPGRIVSRKEGRSHSRWALDERRAGPDWPNTHASPDDEDRAPPPPSSQRMMGSGMGAYGGAVRPVESAAGETMLLWGLGQPEAHRNNALVRQAAHAFELDACGRRLSLLQSPSSMSTPGVTEAVVWDSGVVLAKFLEHAVDSQRLLLRGTRAVDLGSGCGLVGCAAALLGAHVVLTDLPDRLKLLRKNVALNVDDPHVPGSARVTELVWGDDPHHELLKEPLPDFVLGSDVIYNEEAVDDLLATLNQLSGQHTTILLAGELRNDAVLECFLEAAMEDFLIACIEQDQWHPEFRSNRVALFILVKKPEEPSTD